MGRESFNETLEDQLVCPSCLKSFTGENFCPDCGLNLEPAGDASLKSGSKGEFEDPEDNY